MLNNKMNEIVIKELLHIIDSYDNNNVSKQIILSCYQEFDTTIIIRLETRGTANKNTPFYFANMYTYIIKEYWNNNIIGFAEMLYTTKTIGDQHE